MKMLRKLHIAILVVLLQLHYSQGQLTLSKEVSGCAGRSVTLDCTSSIGDFTNTVFLDEVIYGIRSDPSKDCGYTSGDCFQERTDKICTVTNQKCTLPVYTTVNLPCLGAEKKAEYLRAQFTCVPISFTNNLNTYDICSGGDLSNTYGIIQSPNFPKYTTVDAPCIRKLVAPAGQSFSIWILEINIKRADANGCSDYVKIGDSKGITEVCGLQPKSFARQFCSNEIYISYKATTPQLLTTYKGFKLYYETFPVGANSGCPTGPGINPTEGPATTTTTTPAPALTDTQATPLEEFKLCKGQTRDFVAPTPYHLFYLEEFLYGVSRSDPQGTCPASNSNDCVSPAPTQCTLKNKCTITFVNNIAVSSCGGQNAQYIYGRFRYIPIQSTSTAAVCIDNAINADAKPRGVITSRGYPTIQQNENCKTTLSFSDRSKVFQVYITDLSMDIANPFNGQCQNSYVKVSDQGSAITYCGFIGNNRIYSFTSCSNTATIEYKTSATAASNLNGFRAYYEVIDKQFECSDTQTTTTTRPSVTSTPSTLPLFSPILTTDNQKCATPFVYKQQSYDNCINADFSGYWCSVSGNADVDGKKSNCKLGLTQNVQYNICSRQTKRLTCPKNYVIFVFSADYAVTEDKTCDGKVVCTGSDNNVVKNTCAGKNECSLLAGANTVIACQNKVSDILQLDYACLPDNVAGIKSYDVCGADTLFESKGFVTSPNYPSVVASRDCQNKVISFGSRIQFISVYAVSIEVGTSAIIGTKCQNSFLTINDGDKYCGSVKPTLLYEGCSNFFKVGMSVGAETKGFKLYYEVVDDSSICSQSTTTTQPTTITSPQITSPPPYVNQGVSSPTVVEHFCANANTVKTISCPNNYIIAFREKKYGVSNLGGCFFLIGDCTAYVDGPEDNCAGSQSCTVRYSPIQLPNCQNKFSSYLRIEYDCIPVGLATQPMCDRTFTAKNGLIASPNFPQYKPFVDCSTQITVSPDKSIKLYVVNVALNPICSKDSLTIMDPTVNSMVEICGSESTNLATQSCTNQLNIRLRTGDVSNSNFRGVQLYYEEAPKALNLQCLLVTTTKTTQPFTGTTTTTTTTTTTQTKPPYVGFASATIPYVACSNITFECPNDYVIVIKESAYGVSTSNQCGYSPNDCFAKYNYPNTLCAGFQKCSIIQNPSASLVTLCGNKYANYVYIQYQCVPKTTAGNPPKEQIELCGANSPTSIAANSAVLFKSPDYPAYPVDTKQCSQNITVPSGSTIMAYAVDLNFQGSQATGCETTSNYLLVSDGAEKASYCGALNRATFIFQTRSNWINLQYLLKNTISNAKNRGFLLYLEAYTTAPVTGGPVTSPPTPPPTRTTVNLNGLAGPHRHDDICVNTQKELYCSNKYVLIILDENLVSSGTGCSHSGNECKQRTEVVTNACAGKTECLLYLAPTPIPTCVNRVADFIDFEFQCIPTEPAGGSRIYSCDSPSIDKVKNGFIISPGYSSYTPNVRNCDIKITPNANEGVKLFLIDLATSQPNESGCIDGLVVNGGETLCGTDTARELLETFNSDPVTVSYSSLNTPQDGLRGFKIYFETYPLSNLATTTERQTKAPRTTPKNKNSGNSALYGVAFGVGLPLIVVIVGLMYYFKRLGNASAPQIRFSSKNNESKINEDIRSFANPNASL